MQNRYTHKIKVVNCFFKLQVKLKKKTNKKKPFSYGLIKASSGKTLLSYLLASCLNCSAHPLSDFWLISSRIFIVLWKCPHDKLTLTAVSCLSPVSTHTLIPAILNASIVSRTLSCSLTIKEKNW